MPPPAEQKGSGEPRGTRARALIYLAAAIAAALGTSLLLTRYMDARVAAVRVPTEKVVVAASDLPIATTLRPELLASVDWPLASMPAGTARDPQELTDQVVAVPVVRGEPVLRSKLASGAMGKSALSTALPAGMRAVSVRVDDVVAVAGFIHPGDRVDVIVTMKTADSGDAPIRSKVILQNVKVLAVGKELDSRNLDPQKPIAATVATLQVDSQQAEMLALAASKGQILLALRGGADEDVVRTGGSSAYTLYAGHEPVVPVKVAKRAPPPPPPPRPSKDVEILRGDLFERRDFGKGSNP
jgi:pilus assembly protein CpaB